MSWRIGKCWVEDWKDYEKVNAPIKKVEGGKVIFDESLGANISEGFSEAELRDIFCENGLKVLDIKKEGIGYFCRLSKSKRDKLHRI